MPVAADAPKILPSPSVRVRASKVGRWRALVLLAVHALIALHVAHWMSTGTTLSPLEPSESMEFTREGLLNAGAIFFALTIGSTLLLGRWFCGWACHIVALQDGARWLLRRVGWNPKELDVGPLAAVPWLAAVYMFVAPAAVRLVIEGGLAPKEVHLTTTDFWKTFPDWPVALLTFVVCGGLAVLLLGSKGFCTSACPYAGLFGIADQLAPWRIRVNSACNGCGHCTAVCTSNVKVHAEVRDYGTVVDAGCMKCMDCVSSCPNGALRVGFGWPAWLTKAKSNAQSALRKWELGRELVALGFTLAAVAVFHYYDGVRSAYVNAPNWWVVMGIAVGAWALGLVFRSRAAKRRGTSTGEDALLAVLFVGSMYAVRGLYGWMPFLLSLGTSSIVAYLGLATWRALRSSDYALQHWTLKAHGRWTKAGAIYLLLMMLVYGGAGYGASEQLALARSARAQEALHHGLRAAQRGDMEQAIRDFAEARRLDTGLAEARDSLAGAYCAVGRYDEGLALFEESLQARPQDLDTRMLAVRAAMEANMAERALGHLEVALRLAPNDAALLDLRQRLLEARGQ